MQPYRYLNGPWENSELPTIVQDDEHGGDPRILATIQRVHNPDALYELCRLANRREQYPERPDGRHEMREDPTAERIMEARVKLERARRNALEPDAIALADIIDDLAFLMQEIADRLPPPAAYPPS